MQRQMMRSLTWQVLACLILLRDGAPCAAAARTIRHLNGVWLFQTNGAPPECWKPVHVPSDFQSHEGAKFQGIGWYRRQVTGLQSRAGRRWLLQFQAAATEAEVWWNGLRLGTHLGGWTPFRFDVTEAVRAGGAASSHEIRVRLDPKIGHNTQGFLPVIQPHYGGLWQGVQLIEVPETYVDDLGLLAVGNLQTSCIELELPLRGTAPERITGLTVRYRLRGRPRWTVTRLNVAGSAAAPDEAASPQARLWRSDDHVLHASIPVWQPRLWSPSAPNLYEVEIELTPGTPAGLPDRVRTRAAFRTVEIAGEAFRLNGRPLQVRGLLNWGYYPPRLSPNPGEPIFRRDLQFARACGFNLMKCCLWVPPKRFLELADELGVLVWMEYPTWHPDFTLPHLETLRREYREFYCHDRNHPSVILRSLTCETGHGADERVLRALYDEAHRMIPGAVVEDDSSWIGWHRITDFYDDHPYGNNHTWPGVLAGLREVARTNALGCKPLVLGEAMAADTWVPRQPYLGHSGPPRPYWFPGAFDAQQQWVEQLRALAGPMGLAELEADSLRYAMLMRKYQAETFRREIPHGGYVVSVIRDIPTASMGLLDYRGQPKWLASDWAWQRDTICLLKTAGDQRSFTAGERLVAELWISHCGPQPLADAVLLVEGRPTDGSQHAWFRQEFRDIHAAPGSLGKAAEVAWRLPELDAPQRLIITAKLKTKHETFANAWPVWVVPRPVAVTPVLLHASVSPELAAELFPDARPLAESAGEAVVVASRFDDQLVQMLEQDGRVLLLPDGQRGSLPLNAHWFLRGAPYVACHPLTQVVPRDLLVELQHFDLAGDVIPKLTYLNSVDPVLLLWDTHDLREVRTHGLIFETRAGCGRLLVSEVKHSGARNAAGRWLLAQLLQHLANGPAPRHALADAEWARLKEKLHEQTLPLADRLWAFRPDPRNEGLSRGWHLPEFVPDATWTNLTATSLWESQGFATLDGWAWYRLTVQVPHDWQGRPVYLSFEGVDDAYELYVNGKLAGSGGDIVTRQTAFEERKSHDLTGLVQPGQCCVLAVRVYDWYGAGGIFRPVTLRTAPLRHGGDIIR